VKGEAGHQEGEEEEVQQMIGNLLETIDAMSQRIKSTSDLGAAIERDQSKRTL